MKHKIKFPSHKLIDTNLQMMKETICSRSHIRDVQGTPQEFGESGVCCFAVAL